MNRRTLRDCVLLAIGIAVVVIVLAALSGLLSDAIWIIVPVVGIAWFCLIAGRRQQSNVS